LTPQTGKSCKEILGVFNRFHHASPPRDAAVSFVRCGGLVTLPGSSSFDIFGFLNEFIVTAVRDDDASEAIARAFAFVSLSSRTRGVTRARGCDDGSGRRASVNLKRW